MQPDGGVLIVHAHPDDECFGTGGTIARLVAEGARVDLVTCTDGAEGEIHDPELDPEEARPRLAAIRAQELACSLQALGDGGIRQHGLGFRDSGMMGTEPNGHPDSFWQADLGAATERLLDIVRDARPAAIVTYDEFGLYGHPDHINAARIARDTYLALAGTPDAVSRFYEIAFVRERWEDLMGRMAQRGIPIPWSADEEGDDATPPSTADGEPDGFGRPDAEVTTRVDISGFADRKRRSMECHRTQRQDMGWLLELPPDLGDLAFASEDYVLRWLDGADVPATTHRETWLLP